MLRHFIVLTLVIASLTVVCSIIMRSKTETDFYNGLRNGVPDLALQLGQQYFVRLSPASFSVSLNQNYKNHPSLVFHCIKDPEHNIVFFDENQYLHFNHSGYHTLQDINTLSINEFHLIHYKQGDYYSDPLVIFRTPYTKNGSIQGMIELGFDGRELYQALDRTFMLILAFAFALTLVSLGLIGIISILKKRMTENAPEPSSHKVKPIQVVKETSVPQHFETKQASILSHTTAVPTIPLSQIIDYKSNQNEFKIMNSNQESKAQPIMVTNSHHADSGKSNPDSAKSKHSKKTSKPNDMNQPPQAIPKAISKVLFINTEKNSRTKNSYHKSSTTKDSSEKPAKLTKANHVILPSTKAEEVSLFTESEKLETSILETSTKETIYKNKDDKTSTMDSNNDHTIHKNTIHKMQENHENHSTPTKDSDTETPLSASTKPPIVFKRFNKSMQTAAPDSQKESIKTPITHTDSSTHEPASTDDQKTTQQAFESTGKRPRLSLTDIMNQKKNKSSDSSNENHDSAPSEEPIEKSSLSQAAGG